MANIDTLIAEKKSELEALNKKCIDLSSLVMRYEEQKKELDKKVIDLKNDVSAQQKHLSDLEKKTEREKTSAQEKLNDILQEISVERKRLADEKEKTEQTKQWCLKEKQSLVRLSDELHRDSEKLFADKKDFDIKKAEQEQQADDNKDKELNLLIRKEEFDEKEKEINEKEKNVLEREQAVANDKVLVDSRAARLKKEIVDFEVLSATVACERNEIKEISNRVAKKEASIDGRIAEIEELKESLKKQKTDLDNMRISFEKKIESLNDYEKSLELKRLQLLREAKNRDIELDIEKLNKDIGE